MIALASDHAGFALRQKVAAMLTAQGHEYRDFGCESEAAADYAPIVQNAAKAILSGECERGIVICGTGIGVSIAVNRFKGIRAALCGDVFMAKSSRLHNDANILCLGERVTGLGTAEEIVKAFLSTPFSGEERHARRIRQIDEA